MSRHLVLLPLEGQVPSHQLPPREPGVIRHPPHTAPLQRNSRIGEGVIYFLPANVQVRGV